MVKKLLYYSGLQGIFIVNHMIGISGMGLALKAGNS
jgi:hypothetical protein